MLQYLLKRLFLFIPTLIILSLVAFGLSKFAPGDPPSELGEEYGGSTQQRSKAYYEKAVFLGLDKPVFYCSFLPAAYPDTLYRVIEKTKRNNLKQVNRPIWQLVENRSISSRIDPIGKQARLSTR